MPKLLISIPPVLNSRIEDAISFGGFATKAELFRQAVTILLDEKDKCWAAQRAKREAFLIQRHSLKATQS